MLTRRQALDSCDHCDELAWQFIEDMVRHGITSETHAAACEIWSKKQLEHKLKEAKKAEPKVKPAPKVPEKKPVTTPEVLPSRPVTTAAPAPSRVKPEPLTKLDSVVDVEKGSKDNLG